MSDDPVAFPPELEKLLDDAGREEASPAEVEAIREFIGTTRLETSLEVRALGAAKTAAILGGVVALAVLVWRGGPDPSERLRETARTEPTHETMESVESVEPVELIEPAQPANEYVTASDPDPVTTMSRVGSRVVPSESELIARAQEALARRPTQTLSLANQHRRAYREGVLAQERELLTIEALIRLGRRRQAQRRGEAFEARWPQSPHLRRIGRLLDVPSQVELDPATNGR